MDEETGEFADPYLTTFSARLTAEVDLGGGEYGYEFDELVGVADGTNEVLEGGRSGTEETRVLAFDLNGEQVAALPVDVRLSFRCEYLDASDEICVAYEFLNPAPGAPSDLTVDESTDADPVEEVVKILFDADQFDVSEDSPGVALVEAVFTVEELDGAPSVNKVRKIQFDQADGFSVTDMTGGVVKVKVTGGGGFTNTGGNEDVPGPINIPTASGSVVVDTLTLGSAGVYLVTVQCDCTLLADISGPHSFLSGRITCADGPQGSNDSAFAFTYEGIQYDRRSFHHSWVFTVSGDLDVDFVLTLTEGDGVAASATLETGSWSWVKLS